VDFYFIARAVLVCFLLVVEVELGLHLEPLHESFLCERFFKIGSHKVFAWAGFEL
jgi:hypothetical protein